MRADTCGGTAKRLSRLANEAESIQPQVITIATRVNLSGESFQLFVELSLFARKMFGDFNMNHNR